MKVRTLVITIAVLAVLSAIVAYVQRRPEASATDPRVGQPLVDRNAVEKAAKLKLADQGKSVLLVRQPDGTWRDASYYDLPVDFQKLTRFVDDLTEAKLQRLVTTNPERLARLEFKDTKLDLLDSGDKELWSVTLGKAADTGGRFIKFSSEQKAYLANLNAWIDADPKNWAESQLLSLKPDDIAKIEFALPVNAGGAEPAALVVSRAKKEDAWKADKTPANEQLKPEKISSFLSSVTTLRFTDTATLKDPKVAEAKQHEHAYKLTTFDGKTYTVAVGRKPEEKKLKAPVEDAKSGPAALGKVEDLAKADAAKKEGAKTDTAKSGTPAPTKPLAPEFETIPAGPAFAFISSSDASAPINASMQKRAFEIADYAVTTLPATTSELFGPAPAAAVATKAAKAPAAMPSAEPKK